MNLLGTQFEPTSVIRGQLPMGGTTDQSGIWGTTFGLGGGSGSPAITGSPWNGTSGGLAITDDSSGGVVGQPVDLTSVGTVPSVSPGGNPNPASTTFSVTSTFTNLVNTVIQDVTGLIPWIVLLIVAWFVYKHFFKHHR